MRVLGGLCALVIVLVAFLWFGYNSGASSQTPDYGPKFGSSKRLSTPAGFLEGSWVLSYDVSTARAKRSAELARDFAAFMPAELTFESDGRYTYSFGGFDAHGVWTSDGIGINLALRDIDGRSPKKVKDEFERYQSLPEGSWQRTFYDDWFERGSVGEMAAGVTRLELYTDSRRLLQPGDTPREDGTTFIGATVWTRER